MADEVLYERDGHVAARTRIPTGPATAIAVGDDAAWVSSSVDGKLWRVGSGPEPSLGSLDAGVGIVRVQVHCRGCSEADMSWFSLFVENLVF